MRDLKTPNGLRALGYTSADIPGAGRRDASAASRDEAVAAAGGPEELSRLFEDSMIAW